MDRAKCKKRSWQKPPSSKHKRLITLLDIMLQNLRNISTTKNKLTQACILQNLKDLHQREISKNKITSQHKHD